MKKILMLGIAMLLFSFAFVQEAYADTKTNSVEYPVTPSVITLGASSTQSFIIPLSISNVTGIKGYVIELYVSSGVGVSVTAQINTTTCRTWNVQMGSNYIDCTNNMTTAIASNDVNVSFTNNALGLGISLSAKQTITYEENQSTVNIDQVYQWINEANRTIQLNVSSEGNLTRNNGSIYFNFWNTTTFPNIFMQMYLNSTDIKNNGTQNHIDTRNNLTTSILDVPRRVWSVYILPLFSRTAETVLRDLDANQTAHNTTMHQEHQAINTSVNNITLNASAQEIGDAVWNYVLYPDHAVFGNTTAGVELNQTFKWRG